LQPEGADSPFGIRSSAGKIFGTTGGVMEAALTSAYYFATGKNPDPDAFSAVRSEFGIRETLVEINGIPVRAAVASGLGKAEELIKKIESGQAAYDFVEIMACPGGCSGGGGQPIADGDQPIARRNMVLYELDQKSCNRFSHENLSVAKLYEEFLEKPLSQKSHELLHTDHSAWNMPI
jgi:NADH-quinone oxidoreductase subunit G